MQMRLRFRLPSLVNRKSRVERAKSIQEHGGGSVLSEPKVKGSLPSFMEVYALMEPHVYAAISRDPETGGVKYHVIEPTLTDGERKSLDRIREIILHVINVNLNSLGSREKAEEWLSSYVDRVIRNYKVNVESESLGKIKYYLARDLVGFGKIDPMMHDHMLEDISCDGPRIPIYVWHRVYESLPTNVTFDDEGELDSFIVRLAYLAGKHISIASPMLDASLRDGSRIQLTYGREVTRKGSTFTIRRFRADPLTIPDLIELGTMSPMMAAWFWIVVERKLNILIGGGTASGKTTTLNALCTFIPANSKIVTIEDTPELNIPHENWVSSVARVGFGPGGVADITLYDLLKAAMRQRPDYVIVGEVRGEEAYILFQAMATGHGGISSLHCDSVTSAFSRLESEPMNIPRTLIPILNVVLIQSRTRLAEKVTRKVTTVVEIVELDPVSKEIITNEVFRWDPKRDVFEYSGRSILLDRIMKDYGVTREYLTGELERRGLLLEWAARNRIRRVGEVGELIRYYYINPEGAMEKVKLRLRG